MSIFRNVKVLNFYISGITNSQVQLSATLFSNSFLILESEQIKLAKQLGQIDLSVQTYFLEGGKTKDEVLEMTRKNVDQVKISANLISDLTEEFSNKVMDDTFEASYLPYQHSIETYLYQVILVLDSVEKGDTASAKENNKQLVHLSEAMQEAESQFRCCHVLRVNQKN